MRLCSYRCPSPRLRREAAGGHSVKQGCDVHGVGTSRWVRTATASARLVNAVNLSLSRSLDCSRRKTLVARPSPGSFPAGARRGRVARGRRCGTDGGSEVVEPDRLDQETNWVEQERLFVWRSSADADDLEARLAPAQFAR